MFHHVLECRQSYRCDLPGHALQRTVALDVLTVQTGRWEHFPHGADIGVRGFGATREQAFEQAALAMSAVITDPEGISASGRVEISCQAPDDELLLVDWLNALLYEMATRNWLFGRFAVQISDQDLTAQAWGEALDSTRHRPAVEVKGATYTALRVAREADGSWIAQCVVDV